MNPNPLSAKFLEGSLVVVRDSKQITRLKHLVQDITNSQTRKRKIINRLNTQLFLAPQARGSSQKPRIQNPVSGCTNQLNPILWTNTKTRRRLKFRLTSYSTSSRRQLPKRIRGTSQQKTSLEGFPNSWT